MWDTFWRVVIFTALICALATCTSCAILGGGESSSELVNEMADNCKYGQKRASVKKDGDKSETVVDCMEPARYSL